MTFKVSEKETRYQPSGVFDILVNDVFDIYPQYSETDENEIIGADLVDDEEETMQSALIAVLRQRGVDPIEPFRGVRWSQSLLGELPGEALITDINVEAKLVSVYVSVFFETYTGEDGETYLAFSLKVVK